MHVELRILSVLKSLLLGLLIVVNPITVFILGVVQETAILVPWESLGTPPGKAAAILGADLRDTGVFVKTLTGDIYQWGFGAKQAGWLLTSADKVKDYNFLDCLMGHPDAGRHLPGEVAYHAVYWCGEWDYGRAYYAISGDGSVWVWKYGSDTFELMTKFIGRPLLALALWLVVGLGVYVASARQNAMRAR